MPAIQVARTDTFEQQRQKINQIGTTLFNVTSGGSDLSTGNLKLGNGSVSTPSLSFASEPTLGIYRPESQIFSVVSSSKRVFDFSNSDINTYRNFQAIQSALKTENISITSYGENYDPGSYSSISILGGSGTDASANIVVTPYSGQVTNFGYGYNSPGNYTAINLFGGSGTNAAASFTINNISGTITSPGSNYTDGTYLNVPLTTNGSGINAIADITVLNGEVTNVVFVNNGSGYENGDTLSVLSANIGGTGSGFVYTITSNPSEISNFSFVSKGSGYLSNEILRIPGTQSNISTNLKGNVSGISTTLSSSSADITVSSTTGIVQGMIVTVDSGTGELGADTTVVSVTGSTLITLSTNPVLSGSVVLNFTSPGNTNEIIVTDVTFIVGGSSVSQTSGTGTLGTGITVVSTDSVTNTVTLSATPSVAGTAVLSFTPPWGTPTTEFGYTIGDVGVVESFVISGGGYGYQQGDIISLNPFDLTQSISYTVTISNGKYYIDDGNTGPVETPDLTLYSGNTYTFTTSDPSNVGNTFSFSEFPGGKWGTSLVENVNTTLSAGSTTITVTSTANIVSGMLVTVTSGTGQLLTNTLVESVDSLTQLTLSKLVFSSGSAILKFEGTPYTEGVFTGTSSTTISVTESTPPVLYYYSTTNPDLGGSSGFEAQITIDSNNPKVFGSGFSGTVAEVDVVSVASISVESGNFTSQSISSLSGNINNITSTSITSQTLSASSISTNSINSSSNLDLVAANIIISGDFKLSNNNLTISSATGNLSTSGYLKTSTKLNVNDILSIENNIISSSFGNDIVITPPVDRVLKVNNTSALTIPSGNTSQRPLQPIAESGSIRFNTDTNQYEGYSSISLSWSSLGGVRDLDGNTFILAEESVGSNDNTLWFFQDNVNTLKFTPEYQEFVNIKKIRSLALGLPNYENWNSNTSVESGDYLKYRNNIYEVISGGITATSGNEPTDITGSNFSNGTSTLRFYSSAVAPLTFEEISEIRIAPLGGTSLVINADLRLSNNTISTDINDLTLSPNTGKKVFINSNTSLVLPSGTINERGNPIQGSVRFNTTISQYEG